MLLFKIANNKQKFFDLSKKRVDGIDVNRNVLKVFLLTVHKIQLKISNQKFFCIACDILVSIFYSK